jgi:membrane fusion protein, multidrug efflux system
MKKTLLIVVVLACATAGITVVFRHRQERSVQATSPSPVVAVDVTSPTRSTIRRTIEVYGTLSPKNATSLKSELIGKVLRMNVKEWDLVKPGQVLLEMDPTDFQLEVNRNASGVMMARAQQLQAQVDLNRARREWDRAEKLKAGGLITGQDLDERRTGLESAEARVALAQAQVSQAEAQLAEAQRHLQKSKVTAPIKGVVSERKVDVGDFLDKATPLFTLVDNRILDFTANVPATDLPLVAEGQTLTFTVDGMAGRSFKGSVKRVNPTVNANDRTGRILAEVQNHEGVLRGGLYARGFVLVEEKPDALVLKKTALSSWSLERGMATVLIVDTGETVRAQPVQTGLGLDDVVEVTSGLSGSERVIVRGGFNVREGDRVRVNPTEDGGLGVAVGVAGESHPTKASKTGGGA